MKKQKEFCRENRFFLIFLLIWVVIISGARTAQHFSFQTNAYDLSIFDYMMSYTLKGEFMPEPFHGYWGSHFAIHFTPILFLLVPLYLLLQGPLFLLYVQVISGALAAFVLYLTAKDLFPAKYIPSFIGMAFLVYRPFLNGLMYDFHPEMFFPLFLFSSYYFLFIKRRMWPFFVFASLALLIKEDIPLFIFFFGLFLFFKLRDDRKTGLITAGGALIYFVIVMGFVIPHLRSRLGMSGKFEFLSLWGGSGENVLETLKNLISRSHSIIANLPFANIGSGLFNFFAPLLFIPFLSPFILLAVPPMAILATSASPIMHGFGLHYAANILPFLFLAFLFGLKKVESLIAKKKKPQKILVAISACIFLINLVNTKWELLKFSRYSALKDYKTVENYISSIPREASVASLSAIIPHIPKRKNIHMLPKTGGAEYILVHSGINLWPYQREEFDVFLEKLAAEKEYECVAQSDGILLFRKRSLE